MKYNIFLIIALFFLPLSGQTQHNAEFVNNEATFKIQNGAIMTVKGDMHNIGSLLDNDGLLEIQGNLYANNTFQQRGTGTVRLENNDVNIGERQFISGSYAVRGGTAQIGVDDGSFYDLELANTAGILYLVGTGNMADVRNSVDFLPSSASGTPNRNNIVTQNIGTTGAITYPANGANYAAVFGMMNNSAGTTNFKNSSINAGGNLSTIDQGYIIGRLRRAIAPTGGVYDYVLGLEPAATTAARGLQYIDLDVANNTYDVIEGYFQQGSPNNNTVGTECGGYQMDNFWGDRHGEWVFNDINNINGGEYEVTVWPQDPTVAFSGTVWTISKDDVYLYPASNPLNNDCGPSPLGLDRGPFNGFSEFGLVSSAVFVPIELLSLTAKPIKNQFIRIDWATAKEENVDFFELERSLDGVIFEKIGEQKAAGTTTLAQYYTYDDYNVLSNVDYYYRIKTIDIDGTIEYTEIVVAVMQTSQNENLVSIYPNPIGKDDFTIVVKSRKEQKVAIKVYDAIGQLVYNKETNLEIGVNQLLVNSDDWASGVYFVQIRGVEWSKTKELIKLYEK